MRAPRRGAATHPVRPAHPAAGAFLTSTLVSMRKLLLAAALAAAPLFPPAPAAGQQLPAVPAAGGCRSEMEARLAFGLCPDSTFDFYAGGQYRAGVPTPEQVLGYPIGSWHTTHGRMERFVDSLARSVPERVRVFTYGESVERQRMHLVAIGSEANIARLDEIRSGMQRLADPRRTSAADAEAIIARSPIVVWINSANDGSETAAFEAAIQIAYQLAAGEDARTRSLRDGALVLINLAHNPESHERAVAWYNSFVAGDPNPVALEHRAPWGLSNDNNHYQFDLNRDALGLTQTESRAVAYELQRWRPQVFVDLHGEVSTYFFPPAADPVSPLYPAQTNRWLDVFGRGNAAAFDQHGWNYYVHDVFDLFYPGYWDTYPSLQGATGMTYETDGGGARLVRWRREDGTILTFADGIAHHFVASLATVETAVRNRVERLRDFHRFFADAARGTEREVRTVVLFPGSDPGRLARLEATLRRHGVEVQRVTRAGTVAGTDFLSGARTRRAVPAGALLVDLAQPNGRVARTLLEPEVEVPREFTQQELARLARNLRRAEGEREEFAFYDVTAWSLPLAMGIDAVWSAGRVALDAEALPPLTEAQAKAQGGWEGEVVGPRQGGVTGRARSAYVWRPGGTGATRLLARLLDEGFNVSVVDRELVVGDSTFPRGTMLVRVERNPAALHDRIAALAREAGVQVLAAQTAYQERGAVGTGGEAVGAVHNPRVAVLAGEGVNITSFGALWFNLERRLGQPFTALRTVDMGSVPLDQFDVLILPDGSGYGRNLGEAAVTRIRDWVRRGGTLIGYAGGAEYLQGVDVGVRYQAPDSSALPADSARAILRASDRLLEAGEPLPPAVSPGARPDEPLPVPGSFLRGRLDPTHWITQGYEGRELPLLVRSLPLRTSLEGANPVVYAEADRLRLSGFTWPDNTGRSYAGGSYLTVDASGQGRVVLFAEDPLFRGVFDAPAQLLWNAVYRGGRAR